MRKGFALLESLIALLIFSLLLIGGAKIFLSLHYQESTYRGSSQEGERVQNLFFLLQNYLQNSFFPQITSNTLKFYPLDLSSFFSISFSALASPVGDHQLLLSYAPANTAFLLSLPEKKLYPIVAVYGKTLEFACKVSGKHFLPLQKQFVLNYANSTLFLNGAVLLEGIREFGLKEAGEWIEIRLCLTQCYEYALKRGEIFESL